MIIKTGIITGGTTLGINSILTAKEKPKHNIQGTQKIIMVGYVWGFGDLGGVAITPGLLNLLYKHFPDYKIATLGGTEPARSYIKEKYPECDTFESISNREAHEHALDKAKADHGGELPPLNLKTINYVLSTFTNNLIKSLKLTNPNLMQALDNCRLFIYPSGMMLNYGVITLSGMDFWDTVKWSLPLLLARKLNIPYGLYAQSIMAMEGDSKYFFKTILEDAAFVSCRDSSTLHYIKNLGTNASCYKPLPFYEMGQNSKRVDEACYQPLAYHPLPYYVKSPKINAAGLKFVPDSTVSFGFRDDKWGEAFMKNKGLMSKEYLVVVPRTWRSGSHITRLIGEERSNRHAQRLQSIIIDWVQKTGMKVLIASETRAQIPQNRPYIYDPLPDDIKPFCEVMDEWWLTEQSTSIFRNARLLIIMDFHSFFLAIPEGTPTLALMTRESGRKIWACHDFKLGDYLFDIDMNETSEIMDKIYSIHQNYEQESKRIQNEVIPHIRAIEEREMREIGKILK